MTMRDCYQVDARQGTPVAANTWKRPKVDFFLPPTLWRVCGLADTFIFDPRPPELLRINFPLF